MLCSAPVLALDFHCKNRCKYGRLRCSAVTDVGQHTSNRLCFKIPLCRLFLFPITSIKMTMPLQSSQMNDPGARVISVSYAVQVIQESIWSSKFKGHKVVQELVYVFSGEICTHKRKYNFQVKFSLNNFQVKFLLTSENIILCRLVSCQLKENFALLLKMATNKNPW